MGGGGGGGSGQGERATGQRERERDRTKRERDGTRAPSMACQASFFEVEDSVEQVKLERTKKIKENRYKPLMIQNSFQKHSRVPQTVC